MPVCCRPNHRPEMINVWTTDGTLPRITDHPPAITPDRARMFPSSGDHPPPGTGQEPSNPPTSQPIPTGISTATASRTCSGSGQDGSLVDVAHEWRHHRQCRLPVQSRRDTGTLPGPGDFNGSGTTGPCCGRPDDGTLALWQPGASRRPPAVRSSATPAAHGRSRRSPISTATAATISWDSMTTGPSCCGTTATSATAPSSPTLAASGR